MNGNYFKIYPWTNVYGLARSVLALGTFLTLLANPLNILFDFSNTSKSIENFNFLYSINFFRLFAINYLPILKICSLVVLGLVITGWRPRVTGIFHAWITWSFMTSCKIIDGGDQITSIMSLLVLPICLTDPRKWHWSSPNYKNVKVNEYIQIAILSVLIMIRIQVSIIYFHAVVGKLSVVEWVNGTVVWYWFKDPQFGVNYFMQIILDPILKNPIGITIITWGTLLLEIVLAMGLFMEKNKRKYLLIAGILFHFSILLVHGLFSFFFAMAGCLILYLRPVSNEFTFNKKCISIIYNKCIGIFKMQKKTFKEV